MEDFFKRRTESNLNEKAFKDISAGKYKNKWYTETLLKDPLTMNMYSILLQDKQFKTIFELGSYNGASAHWLKTLSKQYSNDVNVISFDITNPHGLSDVFKNIPNIEYVYLDTNDIKIDENLLSLPKPWLVIEDCHVNVVETLLYFDNYMTSGDYIIVEDTNTLGPDTQMLTQTEPYTKYGDVKLKKVENFITKSNKYLVDSYYCDLYGYNNTWQWNSVLCKIK